MSKRIYWIAAAAVFIFLQGQLAMASSMVGAKMASTMSTQSNVTGTGGALFINLTTTHDAPPCGLPNNYRYAIKGTDKQMVAQALMAYAMGKTIDIYGTGACEAWGDTETVMYLTVH